MDLEAVYAIRVVVVPLGGASVGDYDLVKEAFEKQGYSSIFSKIAEQENKSVSSWLWQNRSSHKRQVAQ